MPHRPTAGDRDLTLLDVLDLEPGQSAYRISPNEPWTGEPSHQPSDDDEKS